MNRVGIGIDIGGSKTALVIVDESGKIFLERKFSSSQEWQILNSIAYQAMREAEINQKDISVLGLGIAGTTDCDQGIILDAPALKWRNLKLVDKIQPYFQFPVIINNDVNCSLIGEKWLGSGKGYKDLLLISIGTGLGSAVMINGSLVYGANFMAGEMGYFIEKEDVVTGKKNDLGDFGVAENKVSGYALEKLFPSCEYFFELERKGDEQALEVMKTFLLNLSLMISNSISLLNPEKVILSGGISGLIQPHIKTIQNQVKKLTPIPTQIEIGLLGNKAGSLGAAGYGLQNIS